MAKPPTEVQAWSLDGDDGNNTLVEEGPFADNFVYIVNGHGGDDLMIAKYAVEGTHSHSEFDGGDGTDTLSYAGTSTSIVANLATNVIWQKFPSGTWSERDQAFNVENLRGSNHADKITGDGVGNHLWGEGGNDTIKGAGGNDTVDGGSGADSLEGGTGADLILGGSGNDTLKGDADNDVLDGGTGNDILNGGSGTDTARFDTTGSVVVNLGLNLASGALGNDTLSSIEYVTTGSGSDVVYGNTGANFLDLGGGNDYADGGAGNDSLMGGAGADTLLGGSGNDVLSGGSGSNLLRGGAGADVINAADGTDTLRWAAGDIGTDDILGFSLGQDKLSFDTSLFGANLAPGEDLSDVLMVFNAPGVGALLMAQTASHGWSAIGRFHGVSEAALEGAIETGSLFYETTGLGGGAPGDVFS